MTSRLLLIALILTSLQACSAFRRNTADADRFSGDPQLALAFQADRSFAPFLKEEDRARLTEAEARALDFGAPSKAVDWKRIDGSPGGKVIAYQVFRVGGANCRRFQHEVVHLDKTSVAGATACRREGGSWYLVK